MGPLFSPGGAAPVFFAPVVVRGGDETIAVREGKRKTGPDREDERGAPARRVEWFKAPRAYPRDEIPDAAVLDAFLESLTLAHAGAADPDAGVGVTDALAVARSRQLQRTRERHRRRSRRHPADLRLHVQRRRLAHGRRRPDVGGHRRIAGQQLHRSSRRPADQRQCGLCRHGDPDTGLPGAGLYKSVDGGGSFALTGLNRIVWVSRIIVHPTIPSTVYAATNTGLHRTTDGGATWTMLLEGVITDLAMPPSGPQILWAARSFAQADSGVLRSTDGGANWTMQSGKPSGDFARVRLALCEGTPAVVYASFDVAGVVQIWKTTDGGTGGRVWARVRQTLIDGRIAELSTSYFPAAIAEGTTLTTPGEFPPAGWCGPWKR